MAKIKSIYGLKLSGIKPDGFKPIAYHIGVYYIQHRKTGIVYVGSSNQIGKRLDQHVRNLRANRHSNSILQRYYNKYGESAFDCGIIALTKEPELFEKEGYYTDLYKAEKRGKGFNLITDFEGGGKQRRRLSETAKEQMIKTKHRVKYVRISTDLNNPSITIVPSFKDAKVMGGDHIIQVIHGKLAFTNSGKYTWLKYDKFKEIGSIKDYVTTLKNKAKNIRETAIRTYNLDIVNLQTGIFYQSQRQAYNSIVSDKDFGTWCYLLKQNRLEDFVFFKTSERILYNVINTKTGVVYKSIASFASVVGGAPYYVKKKLLDGKIKHHKLVAL